MSRLFLSNSTAHNCPVISLKISRGVTPTDVDTARPLVRNYPLVFTLNKHCNTVLNSGHWLCSFPACNYTTIPSVSKYEGQIIKMQCERGMTHLYQCQFGAQDMTPLSESAESYLIPIFFVFLFFFQHFQSSSPNHLTMRCFFNPTHANLLSSCTLCRENH